MKPLTSVESYCCAFTAAIVAAMVTAQDFPAWFFGSYVVLFMFTGISIDVSLLVLLLFLKNQDNWWGW